MFQVSQAFDTNQQNYDSKIMTFNNSYDVFIKISLIAELQLYVCFFHSILDTSAKSAG